MARIVRRKPLLVLVVLGIVAVIAVGQYQFAYSPQYQLSALQPRRLLMSRLDPDAKIIGGQSACLSEGDNAVERNVVIKAITGNRVELELEPWPHDIYSKSATVTFDADALGLKGGRRSMTLYQPPCQVIY